MPVMDAEIVSQYVMALPRRGSVSNFKNLLGLQFVLKVFILHRTEMTCAVRVLNVLFWVRPLKIFESIIEAVEIKMVDLRF